MTALAAEPGIGDELVELARRAALNAYAPYSGFRVGAALRASDGRIFTGANVENAAYPASSCAEATAVAHAAAEGMRAITEAAVACIDAGSLDHAYPCGRCRQILNEFRTGFVFVATGSGPFRTHTLAELLPHGFKLAAPRPPSAS
ncbi:MAG TPA: cytidine deaminase [Acidimicrobiia bacterium]|jgi:cytidine deaminase